VDVRTGLIFCHSTLQYELLDEMMDFGYPQYTEAKILSEFIKTDAYRMEVNQRPPMAVTNAVSWRMEGIKYKKNEASIYCVRSFVKVGKVSCSIVSTMSVVDTRIGISC
jgi:hypothetical protein